MRLEIGAALIAATLLAGCGGGDEVASGTVKDADGKAASYNVRKDGDTATMTIKSADGEAVIRTGDAAANAALPAGLALYPGAKVTSTLAVSGEGAGKSGGQTSFESGDPAGKIVAWYKAAATRAGYKIETEATINDMAMIGGRKGGEGSDAFQVMVNRADGRSIVTLIGNGGG